MPFIYGLKKTIKRIMRIGNEEGNKGDRILSFRSISIYFNGILSSVHSLSIPTNLHLSTFITLYIDYVLLFLYSINLYCRSGR